MGSTSCEPQISSASNPGDVDHIATLSENLSSTLFLNEEYADVNLIVEGKSFPTHRIILASRSQYFRALLFGGMRESNQSEVELQAAPIAAFKVLLKYIYSGRMSLGELKEDVVLDVLGLSHQWGFEELESSICEFLKLNLQIGNICAILDTGLAFSLDSLVNMCAVFADSNSGLLLAHPSFMNLSPVGVLELISRDSFCAPEEKIFEVAAEWVRRNQEIHPTAATVLRSVRLPLMNLESLLELVRPTGLVEPNLILDAIYNQNKTPLTDVRHRGYLVPEENVANFQKGASIIKGEMRQVVLDGDIQNYDVERGFTRHVIDDAGENGGGIILKLGQQSILNNIRLLLWDRDPRCYSYYVEVSMDQKDWIRVADYTKYHCRSWQNIFFPQRVVRYIKVVGTHNTVNRMFHVVAVQAYFTRKEFNVDLKSGLLVPKENVATVELSACVTEGVSRSRNALINGETRGYDWDSGYTCHQLGSGAIVIQLAQPYLISSMRLLLWDLDDRYYSFFIEVSGNQRNWEMVANKSRERCQSWQILKFPPTPVVYIRIVGTDNSANEVFHCVHFECPSQVEESETSPTSPKLKDGTGGASNLNSPAGSFSQSYSARSNNGQLRSPPMNLNVSAVSGAGSLNPLDDIREDPIDNEDEDVGIEHGEEGRLEVADGDDELPREDYAG